MSLVIQETIWRCANVQCNATRCYGNGTDNLNAQFRPVTWERANTNSHLSEWHMQICNVKKMKEKTHIVALHRIAMHPGWPYLRNVIQTNTQNVRQLREDEKKKCLAICVEMILLSWIWDQSFLCM